MSRFVLILGLMLLVAGAVWFGLGLNKGQESPPAPPPALQVTDLVVGAGEPVRAGDYVSVHYTGWFFENQQKGEKFDSSVDRQEPFVFRLGRGMVIKGWDDGLEGMRIGGRRTLVVSPDLAYGRQGNARIPPGATLLFEVELLGRPAVEFQTLEAGQGPVAEEGDQVTVHYTGWLAEEGRKGKEFDSSRRLGKPFAFTLGAGQVIPGWDLGVARMKVGEKRQLVVPPELAYGPRGVQRGGVVLIPPAAALLFEVELLEVAGKQ